MSLGVGLTVSLTPPAAGAGGGLINRLLWSESLSNLGAWSIAGMTTIPDSNGPGEDEIVSFEAPALIWQIAASAASTGAPVTVPIILAAAYGRFAVTGTFAGLPYTFSVELANTSGGGGTALVLRLDRFGGGLRCQIEDALGTADFLATRAQLEQAAAFTTYHVRGGS